MGRRRSAAPRFSLFAFQDIITCTTGIMLMITLVMALQLVESSAASPPAQTRKLVVQLDSELDELADQTAMLEEQFQQQEEILNSGALIDASTLRSQQFDVQNRQEQVQSELDRITQQQQQTQVREQQITDTARQRSGERDEIKELREKIAQAQQDLEEMREGNRVIFNPAPGSNRTPWLVQFSAGQILAAEMGKSGPPQSFSDVAAFLVWAKRQPKSGVHFLLLVKPDAISDYSSATHELRRAGFTVGMDVLTQDQEAISPTTGAGTP